MNGNFLLPNVKLRASERKLPNVNLWALERKLSIVKFWVLERKLPIKCKIEGFLSSDTELINF